MDHFYTIALGICVGIGLSASCGFRIFVPMLVMSIAAKAGALTLSAEFAWLESWGAIIGLSVATILEVGAYYIPWLDNALDTVTTPSAAIAGTVTAAACFTEIDPFLQWSLALIAGGGSAGVISTGTTAVRGISTVTTGGFGNFVVATGELLASLFMSLLSIVFSIGAAILAIILVGFSLRYAIRWLTGKRSKGDTGEPDAKPA
ncbi:MAG: hypothetical protein CL681_16790 [Blastopirellula sp.]|nr:hypothetical protein [Blastopirellula sp.]